jgi:hypothetical protein
LSTRLAVSSFTSARVSSLSARDTVAGWTPATRATSRSVTAAPGLTFEIAIDEQLCIRLQQRRDRSGAGRARALAHG